MRDLIVLLVHIITIVLRISQPGGLRSVIAESVLIKHQLLIVQSLSPPGTESPRLGSADRRILFAVDQAETFLAISDRIQAIDPVEFPSRSGPAQIPDAVFA